MYEYACTVRRVVDGDTLDLDIDLGLGIHAYERVRLNGIDCPEMNTAEGKAAKIFAQAWLDMTPDIRVDTIKDREDKYGRYLAELYDGRLMFAPSLNEALVKNGHAKPYDGGKR